MLGIFILLLGPLRGSAARANASAGNQIHL